MNAQNTAVASLLQADPETMVSSWIAEAGGTAGSVGHLSAEARKLLTAL